MKNKWVLLLLSVNVAVVVVVLAVSHPSNARELLSSLAYGLVYANIAGSLGIWLLGGAVDRLAARKVPLAPVIAVGMVVIVAVGCLVAQMLLLWAGLVVPRSFWLEYLQTLRLAMPLAIGFGVGTLMYGSLQARVQLMENKLRERDAAAERAKKLAAEARLRWLESRIHPHFLFNTLNSISSLIATNPARAEEIVGRLAVLLRASLDTSDKPLIPLRQELAMVESYVEIEKVRFGNKLSGRVEVPTELQEAKVPPMSVQSLVENAVKHGINPQVHGGEFAVTASTEGPSLCIQVRDTGPGFDLAAIRAGHGLDNLVERLDALFGANARLNVFRQNGYSVVEMILPRV